MAEKLASLKKKGGKLPIWQTNNADVTDTSTVAAGATKNVAVTQMPRYIQMYRTVHGATNDYGFCCMYDVENNSGVYTALGSSGVVVGRLMSNLFGNITSSVVQVKGPASGSSSYTYAIAIWY